MSNCIKNCKLCRNLVFSTAVTIVTVDGEDTLVITIPSGYYPTNKKLCLVITQTIPEAATITMPVAITIEGSELYYPFVKCDCSPVTACAIRTRRRYPVSISANTASAVFKSLGGLSCAPTNDAEVIPIIGG